MKKFALLILPVLIASTFSFAPLASAAVGAVCTNSSACDTGAGETCINGRCAISGTTSGGNSSAGIPSGSGSSNTTYGSSSGFPLPNLGGLVVYTGTVIGFINDWLVPVLIAIAFIVFLWGVFNYFILGAADADKRKEGREFVLWGIIGFVIIFSLWGLVNLVSDTIGLGGQARPFYPTL